MEMLLQAEYGMVEAGRIRHVRVKSAVVSALFLSGLCLYTHFSSQVDKVQSQADQCTSDELVHRPETDRRIPAPPPENTSEPLEICEPELDVPEHILPEEPEPSMTKPEEEQESIYIADTQVWEDTIIFEPPAKEDSAGELPAPETQVIRITFHANGGEIDTAELIFEEAPDPDLLPVPRRLGKVFAGWYTDESCNILYSGEETIGEQCDLYAGWEEFPGYLSDDNGYIIGYADDKVAADGLLVLPFYEECAGIKAGALKGWEDQVFEAYIPANIVYIEEGAFDNLGNMFYIEVAPDNPVFYSIEGIVYSRETDAVIVYPQGRIMSQTPEAVKNNQ